MSESQSNTSSRSIVGADAPTPARRLVIARQKFGFRRHLRGIRCDRRWVSLTDAITCRVGSIDANFVWRYEQREHHPHHPRRTPGTILCRVADRQRAKFGGAATVNRAAPCASAHSRTSPVPRQCNAAMVPTELAFVSYWEWFKIIVASLLISTAITVGSGFVFWRLMH
jgi:hypothetical protein